MRTAWLASLAFATLSLFAQGAALADTCKSQGSVDAKALIYDVSRPLVAKGIGVSLLLGLEPATSPAAEIARIVNPCTRGQVQAGKKTFQIFGENGGKPERWATSKDLPGTIFYIASMPRPDMALSWSNQFAKDQKTLPTFDASQTMQAFVLAKGDKRYVVAYFDKIPDDARLKNIVVNAFTGKLKPVRGYDLKTHAVIKGKGE